MSSQNEAHGDEDWMDVSDDAVQEAALEIIRDAKLLESQLNDPELASRLSDICRYIDNACNDDLVAMMGLTRSAYHLKQVLLTLVQDKAYEIALNRQINNE